MPSIGGEMEIIMNLKLENMTTEQKLGMLYCARRFEPEDIDFVLDLVKNHSLGAFQMMPYNKEINEKILQTADYPIIVINDAEDGFQGSKLPHVPLMSLAACGKKEYYQAFARGIVSDAWASGVNGTWGPVVDILRGDGPCRVSRVLSDTPDGVTEGAASIAEIFDEYHFLSTAKHYPGTTGIPFDTHMEEGASELTMDDIVNFNLVPYKKMMEKGLLKCIMSDHSVYKNIDPDYPASLSKKCIDIIRNMGFDGICFTDSFAMMGILQRFGEENIYGMAIAAGNDIVLPNYRTPMRESFGMLVKNFNDGVFSMERLDEAAGRVLAAMEYIENRPKDVTVFTEKDRELIYGVAKDCITAITDDGISANLGDNSEDRLFVILTGNGFNEEIIKEEVSIGRWYYPERIKAKILESFPTAEVAFLKEFPTAAENERILFGATKHKEVVFVTFCTTAPYLGTDGLTRRTEAVINALARSGKVSAILHFGNPFALKHLTHIPRKIFGYIIPESQEHAIDVLAGKLEAKGKMPFKNIGLQ